MGTFHQTIEVAGSKTGPFVALEALVDTGATYTLLPRDVVSRMGVPAEGQEEFTLADGRRVVRDVALVYVRFDGRVRETECVIDDDAEDALLGAVTIEQFGLAVDPVNKQLIPARKYLA